MGSKPTKKENKEKDKKSIQRGKSMSVAAHSTSSSAAPLSNASYSTNDMIKAKDISNSNMATSTQETKKPKSSSSVPSLKKTDSEAFSLKRLEELYAKYMDQDDADHIGPENMARFLKDLDVDPLDIEVLQLAWHLEASEMAYFARREFISGFQKMGVDSILKIKNQLKLMPQELEDQNKFKEIYRYAFLFAKEKDQKVLDLQTAEDMLKLVMGDRYSQTKNFLEFLHEQTSYKAINLDQWMNFLEFCKTIDNDFANYDEGSAWPVIFDEFVEWQKERNNVSESNVMTSHVAHDEEK